MKEKHQVTGEIKAPLHDEVVVVAEQHIRKDCSAAKGMEMVAEGGLGGVVYEKRIRAIGWSAGRRTS